MKKVIVVIQARMSSSRLPGKVLMPIAGMPAILLMMNRLKFATKIDDIIVATSTDTSDDPLANVILAAGGKCYRGDLDDVLNRYYEAAKLCSADIVVRVTGDCPLIDPQLVDEVITKLVETGADYATNTMPPTFPDGLDVEVFTFDALSNAKRYAQLKSEREHVTPFIRNNSTIFKVENVSNKSDMSHLRWTVDYKDDYDLVQELINHLEKRDAVSATFSDFISVIENNPRFNLMSQHKRNEGYDLSLAKDVE